MKKIASFLLVIATLLCLTSCAQAPKPEDKRVVLTLSGEKIYYDYFRYVFLNSKADMDGGDIYRALKARGILVRHFDAERIADYNRITVGTKEQMDTLIGTLRIILEERT